VRFFFALGSLSGNLLTASLAVLQSTLLKIMAGIEKEFDGIARPLPGASIGYLSQEPILEYETVKECIDAAVSSSRAILDKYNELSASMANPDITDEEMTSAMNEMERIGNKIEAENLWDLDRTVERAMDSLRVPPGDARTAILSGGEKRRVSLCQLLLESHDMLLLDEVRYVHRDVFPMSKPSLTHGTTRDAAAHEPPRCREHLLARAIP
jgi:ABC-type nitrate/sulfonate/bicarbonate transport system ATPase subunit